MTAPIVTPPSASPAADQPTGPIALAGAPRPAGAPKPKPRKRVNTAEKRHQHNAIERQRRETLNGKFLVLARILPSLAACRRPSKSAIVNGSISHLNHQRQQRLLASKLLRQLAAERDELFAEVNEWRQAYNCGPKVGPKSAWSDEMEEVCAVEKETFGSFANVDENGDDQGEDEDDNSAATDAQDAMNIETANFVAGSYSMTPRSSADMGSSMDASYFAKKPSVNGPAPAGIAWNNSFSVPNMPFNAFMGESGDSSSTGSPVGSHQSAILTPSSMDQANMYTHTPSPRSTASVDEPSAAAGPSVSRTGSLPSQWTPQQLAFFQQQMAAQNQNLQRQQQQAALAAISAQSNLFFGNPQQASPVTPTSHHHQPDFAQLMATMFPQQRDMAAAGAGANPGEQAEQWRKLGLGNVNLGFGLGSPAWNEQPVSV